MTDYMFSLDIVTLNCFIYCVECTTYNVVFCFVSFIIWLRRHINLAHGARQLITIKHVDRDHQRVDNKVVLEVIFGIRLKYIWNSFIL